MAKLKAPLMSLGASQQLGKALVFFAWKGLACVREYVIPSNPKTDAQNTQRGYMTTIVGTIHYCEGLSTHALAAIDKTAYSLWASCYATPRTWFNQILKNSIDQKVAGLGYCVFHGAVVTGNPDRITFYLWYTQSGVEDITAGYIYYGTSKTALTSKKAATGAELNAGVEVTGLTTGVKYFLQYRPTAHADFVGCRSGIYYATPT